MSNKYNVVRIQIRINGSQKFSLFVIWCKNVRGKKTSNKAHWRGKKAEYYEAITTVTGSFQSEVGCFIADACKKYFLKLEIIFDKMIEFKNSI